jgi:hypothetical protein
MSIMKVVPSAAELVTMMLPPWLSATRRAYGSPTPQPIAARAAIDLEDRFHFFHRDRLAVVVHRQLRAMRAAADLDLGRGAGRAVLDGIAQQVLQRALQRRAAPVTDRRYELDFHLDSAALDRLLHHFVGQHGQVEFLQVQRQALAAFEHHAVEQVARHRFDALGIHHDAFGQLADVRTGRLALDYLGRHADIGQRRAQVMRQGGNELLAQGRLDQGKGRHAFADGAVDRRSDRLTLLVRELHAALVQHAEQDLAKQLVLADQGGGIVAAQARPLPAMLLRDDRHVDAAGLVILWRQQARQAFVKGR